MTRTELPPEGDIYHDTVEFDDATTPTSGEEDNYVPKVKLPNGDMLAIKAVVWDAEQKAMIIETTTLHS